MIYYSAIIIFCQEKSAPVRRGTLRNEFMKKFIIGNCIIDSVA